MEPCGLEVDLYAIMYLKSGRVRKNLVSGSPIDQKIPIGDQPSRTPSEDGRTGC